MQAVLVPTNRDVQKDVHISRSRKDLLRELRSSQRPISDVIKAVTAITQIENYLDGTTPVEELQNTIHLLNSL